MTAKEKARKLVKEYLIYFPEFYNDLEYGYNIDKAKECALILVDEIIDAMNEEFSTSTHYWRDVKQELKNK